MVIVQVKFLQERLKAKVTLIETESVLWSKDLITLPEFRPKTASSEHDCILSEEYREMIMKIKS